jgi:aspartyl/asparaginyl beta-hydroxylase (cupin superfamily)
LEDVAMRAALPAEGGGQEVRRVTGEVGIFKLARNSSLVPHTGNTNFRLTAHLALLVPRAGASLTVGDESANWEAGRVLVFDDAFVHSAANLSPDQDRYVLLLNFWKPGFCTNLGYRCFV